MKIQSFVDEWVWVEIGMPILYRSIADGPTSVRHDQIVKIERVEPATEIMPALAIWTDGDGSYGVDVKRINGKVVSTSLRGSTPVLALVKAIERRMKSPKR